MKAYKVVRKFGNVLCSFTTSNLSDLDGKNYLKYSTKTWTVSENSPIFIFDDLERAKRFVKNEIYWGDNVHYPIYECEYTPYLGFINDLAFRITRNITGTILASRVKLIREAGKTKKAFKVVKCINGQLRSYFADIYSGGVIYGLNKQTVTNNIYKPLFCFDTLKSAVDFVNDDYQGVQDPNAKKIFQIFECDIVESQHPYKEVFKSKPAKGTVFADSVVLKKKVFDFRVDNYEKKSNNQNMKIDNQSLKLALGDVERYEIIYEKDGYNEVYHTSGAIDRDEKKISCYAFGKGIRSFRWDKILSIKKINT